MRLKPLETNVPEMLGHIAARSVYVSGNDGVADVDRTICHTHASAISGSRVVCNGGVGYCQRSGAGLMDTAAAKW